MHEQGETLEAFHAALTALVSRSGLGTLEGEIVRDLLISKMKKLTLQDSLTIETLAPEEVLKRAINLNIVNRTQWRFKRRIQQQLRGPVLTTIRE